MMLFEALFEDVHRGCAIHRYMYFISISMVPFLGLVYNYVIVLIMFIYKQPVAFSDLLRISASKQWLRRATEMH